MFVRKNSVLTISPPFVIIIKITFYGDIMIKFTAEIKKLLLTGNIGIEKESHRVDASGFLAKTPHPFPNNKIIKMDFAESQIEIATKALQTPEKVYEELLSATQTVKQKISEKGEFLWVLSNPPLFENEQSIAVANFPEDYEETKFREYLGKKYGKKVMLYSGIHYNFSFSDELLQQLFETSARADFRQFKDELYLKIAKYSFLYSWILVYCTSASPVFHQSFMPESKTDFVGYASMRNSPHGYKNHKNLCPNFSSTTKYVDSIREMIKVGELKHECELYSPIRLKARRGHSLKEIEQNGIDFIELRMFDLNPFDSAGFALCDIKFVQLLIVYIMSLNDFEFTTDICQDSYNKIVESALLDTPNYIISQADEILNNMIDFFEKLNFLDSEETIKAIKTRVNNPKTRYANKLYEMHKQNDYTNLGLKLCPPV